MLVSGSLQVIWGITRKVSCNWETLMAVRERRKRRIKEKRKNIYRYKKGINRERWQCKRGSSKYNKNYEWNAQIYNLLSLEVVLIMGLLIKSSKILRLAPTRLIKFFWGSLSLLLHRVGSSQVVRISSQVVRGSSPVVRTSLSSVRACSGLVCRVSLVNVDQPFLY